MHLDNLEIAGFKSYSEAVRFDFSPTIAVIIGNNGTGKSNALEAILWALGSDDPGLIRAAGPDELLFAGIGDTPPAERAVVTLGFVGGGGQVKVERRLGRDGSHALLLDGREMAGPAQLEAELAARGLAGLKRTFIRQEGISDVVALDPAGRRSYVEALGVNGGLSGLNAEFSRHLATLIPGAEAWLLEQGDGLELEVRFPDKGVKRGFLLSGGERAVTALALKLALFELTNSPAYLLDEVEPSLDWTKNKNTQNLLQEVSARRQLIMVTHLRSTIEMADTVHGVRVRPDGSSWLKFHFKMDERLFKIYKCC
jgi:chromosome segregation protein